MISEQTNAFSFASRIVNSVKEDINFEELLDEQLKLALEEAIRCNRTLTCENEVLERYIQRKSPESLKKMSQIMELTLQAQNINKNTAPLDDESSLVSGVPVNMSRMGSVTASSYNSALLARKISGSQQTRPSTPGAPPKRTPAGLKLLPAHRTDLVEKEIEVMKKQYQTFIKDLHKKKESIEARLKEINVRIIESEHILIQFENEVVNQVDPITKQISKEKFLRFIDNQFKLIEHLVDKFNLNIVTTKRLIRQTKKQIRQREERGEKLDNIDYIKLEIENRHLVKKNEENNQVINVLKQLNAHYNRTLKNHKDKLIEKKALLQQIDHNLEQKTRENIDLRRTQIRSKNELKQKINHLKNIKELQDEYEAPGVPEFIAVQEELQDLKKNVKILTRQRKLQLFRMRMSKKKMNI